MEKLLFIDHSFHKKTRSSDFFIEILRRNYSVEIYYLDPELLPDLEILNVSIMAEVIVIWQMDFLAPIFLSMGKRVVVIPMFDGSGAMPDIHWIFSSKARFLNFSITLNERIRMAGCKTQLLRFFPEPILESKLPRFDKLKAFFWQRRPDHGIHFDYLNDLIGNNLDFFHVHNVPDVPTEFTLRVPSNVNYKYSESCWFEKKNDYISCLSDANVFIAPRVAEGIGMAFLEAMAHGKLVLAHDAPTNNEYINSWENGILFNKELKPSHINILPVAERISRQAWKTVVEGRQQWISSYPIIIEWINSSEPGPLIPINHQNFFIDIWAAYYSGSVDVYTSFLAKHLALLSKLSDQKFDKLLQTIGEVQRLSLAFKHSYRDCMLGQHGLMDLTRVDDRFIGAGWSSSEKEWRWATGHCSELYFSGLNFSNSRKIVCTFEASALHVFREGVNLLLAINGVVVHEKSVVNGWAVYDFEFDPNLLEIENHMSLNFDKAQSLPNDSRVLSVCFKNFHFKV